MLENHEHCNIDSLKALLSREDSGEESPDLLSHLESCVRCRDELARLVGTADDWNSVRSLSSIRDNCDGTEDNHWISRSPKQVAGKSSPMAPLPEAYVRSVLEDPRHPEMLGRIGRYDVERLIGSGGMGLVFKAFDTELNRPVAIKVLTPSIAFHATARHRFAREAKAAAAVVHEHVVPIYNVESNGQLPYLVMHFAQGDSLQSRIDQEGPLELKAILRISQQIASGLSAAHAQGLVHRDVKPANVLLEQGVERALITDFGLAQAADDASQSYSGFLAGTPQYMSPEQAKGERVNHLSDLFSLGCVMYTMCTGRPPFRGDTTLSILQKVQQSSVKAIQECNPDVPTWLCGIIERLMMKHPADRYQSATEVSMLLEQCLAHVQQPLEIQLPTSLAAIESSPFRSRLGNIALATSIAAVLLALFVTAKSNTEQIGSDTITTRPSPQNVEPEQDAVGSVPSRAIQELSPLGSSPQPIVWQGPPVQPTANDAIREKLEQSIRVDWDGTLVAEGIESLLSSCDIDVHFDPSISKWSPEFDQQRLTLHLETSIAQLLARILPQHQLGYIPKNTYVEITSIQEVEENPFLSAYDIANITRNNIEASVVKRAIMKMITPDSWKENGGFCSIQTQGPILLVRATQSMHEQIVLFLAALDSPNTW